MEAFQKSKHGQQSCAKDRGVARSDYFTPRWLVLYGYILIVFISTPYLPLLIRQASSYWAAESVVSFVLSVEISIGVLLMVSAVALLIFNRRKFSKFIIILSGIIVASCLIYFILPNPYELTHLPEYAIMSILIFQAIKELEGKRREKVSESRVYFQSAVITGVFGSVDELYQGVLPMRYFTWYDIFLNGLGGILGLTILWGITKKSVNRRN